MKIPLIQGTLRYLYKSDPAGGAGGSVAEGWAFAFGILGLLGDADPTVAATVVSNMKTTASSPVADGYVAVKAAITDVHRPRRYVRRHRRPRRQLRRERHAGGLHLGGVHRR